MTVYVVEHGCYSDKHVVAVCSTREKADAVAALDGDNDVIECDIDGGVDLLLQGYRAWDVRFSASGDLIDAEPAWSVRLPNKSMGVSRQEIWIGGVTHEGVVVVDEILARDQDEAIKIAADARAQFMATHP